MDFFGISGPNGRKLSAPPIAIADCQRSQEILQKELFLVSDRHSIPITDFGFPDRYPIALRGSAKGLTISGTLGCADKRHPFAITIAIATSIARSGALRP